MISMVAKHHALSWRARGRESGKATEATVQLLRSPIPSL